MKNVIYFLLTLIAFGSAAQAVSPKLETQLTSANVFLIDAPGRSCSDAMRGSPSNTLPPKHFSFEKLSLTWRGPSLFELYSVKVVVNDPNIVGGKYTCTIAGDQLKYLFNTNGMILPNQSVVAPSGPAATAGGCLLACGGVELVDTRLPLSARGGLEIFGIERANGNNDKVIMTNQNFTLSYEP